jgi:hypothetical protein
LVPLAYEAHTNLMDFILRQISLARGQYVSCHPPLDLEVALRHLEVALVHPQIPFVFDMPPFSESSLLVGVLI